jgi:hypothetical protein
MLPRPRWVSSTLASGSSGSLLIYRLCRGSFKNPGSAPRGDAGIRTPCLLRAKQALYQVSYIPAHRERWWGILDSNQGPQSYQDCALTT